MSKADSSSYKFDKESSLIVDMLLEDEEYDEITNAKLQEYITGEPFGFLPHKAEILQAAPTFTFSQSSNMFESELGPDKKGKFSFGTVYDMAQEKRKNKYEALKNKLTDYMMTNKTSCTPPGVSTAMDARLEYGVEVMAEIRLKVCMRMN